MGLMDLLKRQKAQQHQGRADLYKKLQAILVRRAAPKAGDDVAVTTLCNSLGIDERHIEYWATLLDEGDRIAAVITAGDEADRQLKVIADKAVPLEKIISETRERLEALFMPYSHLQQQKTQAGIQRQDLQSLQQTAPWLWGDFDAMPAKAPTYGMLANKRKELGLSDVAAGGWVPTVEAKPATEAVE